MTTARERMLELTSLSSPNTARLHFLSITTGTGPGGIVLEYDKINVKVVSQEINATVVDTVVKAKILEEEINSSIVDNIINSKITASNVKASVPICSPIVIVDGVFTIDFSDDFS